MSLKAKPVEQADCLSVRNGNQNCDGINSRNGDSLLRISSLRQGNQGHACVDYAFMGPMNLLDLNVGWFYTFMDQLRPRMG